MPVSIPDEFLETARLTEFEVRIELALVLFQRERRTLGQAARLSRTGQLESQRLLAQRRIPVHYTIDDLEADLETIRMSH